MDYENLRRKVNSYSGGQPALGISQQTSKYTRAGSLDSAKSSSYQTFYVEEGSATDYEQPSRHTTPQHGSHSAQIERRQAFSVSSPYYSYPRSVKKLSEANEGGYAYATTTAHASALPSADEHEEQTHESLSRPPSMSASKVPLTAVTAGQLPALDAGHEAEVDIENTESGLLSTSQCVGPAIKVIRPTTGSTIKPLVMKMLPLYLCTEDGKVYADQNTASIPTHHLVEVNEDTMKKMLHKSTINPQPPGPVLVSCCNKYFILVKYQCMV